MYLPQNHGEKIVELDSKLTKRVRKFITMGKDIGLKQIVKSNTK